MVVKDESTLEEALQMLESSSEGVRYSDAYSYIVITTPETLELQCRRALARNSIAIVVPRGREHEMESHAQELPRVRKQRAEEEKGKIKGWVKEHPELAKASAEEIPKIMKQIRRKEAK